MTSRLLAFGHKNLFQLNHVPSQIIHDSCKDFRSFANDLMKNEFCLRNSDHFTLNELINDIQIAQLKLLIV